MYRLLIGFLSLLLAADSFGASLYVYSLNSRGDNYVNRAPYLIWSAAQVQGDPTHWIPASQYLAIQTDAKQGVGAWGIQIFTDNTAHKDARPPTYQEPAYFDKAGYVPGDTVVESTAPLYTGYSMEKGGLVASGGKSRLPLIWRVVNAIPIDPMTATENPIPRGCRFLECTWFYMKDPGDKKGVPGAGVVTDWHNGADYQTPITNRGVEYTEGKYWPVQAGGDGYTTQLIYLAANFRNAVKAMYSTNVYVELLNY